MVTVGVMGLGGIATRAYLPVYAAMQDQVTWQMMTRNEDKLKRLGHQFGLPVAGNTLAALDHRPLDAVMIHTPTETHAELVRHFLERGVNVFVDKPLATDMAEAERLYALAEKQGLLLTVGFNRRFAPFHQVLAQQAVTARAVRVMKTRIANPDDPMHALWDLLIHPIDTALMLANFPVLPAPHYVVQTDTDGRLLRAEVTFALAHSVITAGIDEQAGINLEEAALTTDHGILQVQDLSRLTTLTVQGESRQFAPDWQPTLLTRGFQPMVAAFVRAVAAHGPNPVAPETSIQSHQVIADMVAHLPLS